MSVPKYIYDLDHVQLFNDLDHSFNAGPQTVLFNEEYQGYQSFGNVYAPTHNNSIGFQASSGLFEADAFVRSRDGSQGQSPESGDQLQPKCRRL